MGWVQSLMGSMVHRERERACRGCARYALPVAALLSVSHLASAAHMLLVPHAISPVDGQLVHPGHAQVRGGSPRRAAGLPALEPGAPQGPDDLAEHCRVAAQRSEPFALGAPPALLCIPPGLTAGQRASVLGPVAAQVAVHRLAPKQSPPA